MTRRKRLDALEVRRVSKVRASTVNESRAGRALVNEGRALLDALPEDLQAEVLARGVARGVADLIEGSWETRRSGETAEDMADVALTAFRVAFRGQVQA